MRWPSSKLSRSLKGQKNSEAAKTQKEKELPKIPITSELPERSIISELPERPPTSGGAHREKWHQDVNESRDVLQYLEMGYASIGSSSLESLKQSTTDYLRKLGTNHARPSPEYDEILGILINEHGSREHFARDSATIACLDVLSTSAATRHLASFMNVDIGRYLRCIALAGQANPSVISDEELRSAQSLLRMIAREGQDFQDFQLMIETLGLGAPVVFMPLKIIQSALARSGIRPRLQRQLDIHLGQDQFLSVFLLVSWLQYVPAIPNNDNIIAILDGHFPLWRCLSAWRPNIDRIGRWEGGNFTDVQRKKLPHTFELDGPDTATHLQESLKMATHCYEYINLRPQTTEMIESYLDHLYRASILGPGALDLFIYLCIDNPADVSTLSGVNDGLRTGDDSCCSNIHATLLALDTRPSLSHQMRYLTHALQILNDEKILENDRLAGRLSNVMESARDVFCKQLETGTGENIGMLLYDLGSAILQAPWIHLDLPPNLLAQVQQFPSQDILEAIFDQLQDCVESSGFDESRFKSYLASTLGGRVEVGAGSIALTEIREEIRFWKHPPDALRKDLARTFAKMQRMDYSLYTSCLLTMLREEDIYIREMRHIIRTGNEKACLSFIQYLAHRRQLHQLQHECWLLLLTCLIGEQAPSFLPDIAGSMPLDQWLEFVKSLSELFGPIHSQLPQSGVGLTQERLSWWAMLSRDMTAAESLINRRGGQGNFKWLYFPSSIDHVTYLIDMFGQERNMLPIHRQIVAHLASDGSNAISVCNCIRVIKLTSNVGTKVCHRMLSRKDMSEGRGWSEPGLSIMFEAWCRSQSLIQGDKSALGCFRKLLVSSTPPQLNGAGSRLARERLQSEYETLLQRARELEMLRLRLWHQQPRKISTLLQQLGVDDTSSHSAPSTEIPSELIDVVESFSEAEYELSFALTGLSDLQRRARGISQNSRMLLIRLHLQGSPKFCIHFSPDDEGRDPHRYWRITGKGGPKSDICTTRSNLFTYYIARTLHRFLQGGGYSLQSIYACILKLITTSPTTCLYCSNSMSINLWKPAVCSRGCSFRLRTAPLEVRLHNLMVDTLSMDLLLTCVYAAAPDTSNLGLLPGCPVQMTQVRAVIDSIPPLANLQTATDLRQAIQGYDRYGNDREKLLSWLCLKFRGFILAAPDGFRIPSMPNTQQFLLLNSNHEREALFRAQPGSQLSSGAVFHGTSVSRLFLILAEGLKSMSKTQLMVNGAAYGAGVYCGDEQATSLPYAGSTGQSWRNSTLSHKKIMLGCELASYPQPHPGGIHVVANDNSLLVRYVFLLPQNYQAPPRRHVEPAMSTAFAMLRSGLLN